MPRVVYPLEYRQRLVELARKGRSPEELSKEFEPAAKTIRAWVKQADLDEGRRDDGLTTAQLEELRRLRKENKNLREEREILKKADHSISKLCEVLGISRSGYYAWLVREPSLRAQRDAELKEMIRAVHKLSRGTYGALRVHAELKDDGIRIGKKRIARLMREEEMAGVSRRRFKVTTKRGSGRAAPDLVERDFTAKGPDQLWVADITYVPTWSGFLYLAVVLDAWSRRVVGWAMRSHLRTELVLDALEMAVQRRQPTGVIHHSDQGCQYTSIAFGLRCKAAGIRPSMGSVGDAYDNAMCESFFATLECELIDRSTFKNLFEARAAVFEFIEGFYNPHRRHSALGYLSPLRFEKTQTDQVPVTA